MILLFFSNMIDYIKHHDIMVKIIFGYRIMEYKGYVLEHGEVQSKELGWHHYGVIMNIMDKDFDCIGSSLDELRESFIKLVDDNFDELQSLTESMDFDIDMDLIDQLKEIPKYKNMNSAEIATRSIIDFVESLQK